MYNLKYKFHRRHTDIVVVRVVISVDDGGLGGPPVFIDWLSKLLQVMVRVVLQNSQDVLQKAILRDVELQNPHARVNDKLICSFLSEIIISN